MYMCNVFIFLIKIWKNDGTKRQDNEVQKYIHLHDFPLKSFQESEFECHYFLISFNRLMTGASISILST